MFTSQLFMPRRYYSRKIYVNRDKYSIEQRAGQITTDANGVGSVVVVPPNVIQGMRKVKHLTISLGGIYAQTNNASVVYYALVYVPQGTEVGSLGTDGGSLYEPNQFVMSSGILAIGTGTNRISTPMSRNLNSGDQICLVVQSGGGAATYQYLLKYAITLQ